MQLLTTSLFIGGLCALAEATNHSLQTQVSTITSTTSASSSELESIKTRVADVEREKRDLLSVVSRMKEDAASQDGMSLLHAEQDKS